MRDLGDRSIGVLANGGDVISILYLVLTIGVGVYGCSGISPVFGAICEQILFAALLTLFLFSLAGGVGDGPRKRRKPQ